MVKKRERGRVLNHKPQKMLDRFQFVILVGCLVALSFGTCSYLFPVPPVISDELKRNCGCFNEKAIITNPLPPSPPQPKEPNEAEEFKWLSLDQATREKRRDVVVQELTQSFARAKAEYIGMGWFEWDGRHYGFLDALDIVLKEKQTMWSIRETFKREDLSRFIVEPL